MRSVQGNRGCLQFNVSETGLKRGTDQFPCLKFLGIFICCTFLFLASKPLYSYSGQQHPALDAWMQGEFKKADVLFTQLAGTGDRLAALNLLSMQLHRLENDLSKSDSLQRGDSLFTEASANRAELRAVAVSFLSLDLASPLKPRALFQAARAFLLAADSVRALDAFERAYRYDSEFSPFSHALLKLLLGFLALFTSSD